MRHSAKRSFCLFLCFILTFALGGCAGNTEVNEKNITKTVEKVEAALKSFDRETLEKYVSSQTLKYILAFSKNKAQFVTLGQAMFEKLEIDITAIDTANQTVTLAVKNRDMRIAATTFTQTLTAQNLSQIELLAKLSDDAFLDASLASLKSEIAAAIVPDNPVEVTLSVAKGQKNLMLVFDETAEDAVSGGALSAITACVTGKNTAD